MSSSEQVSIKRRARISPVWLIPVAAALIGCWLVYQNFLTRGPEVTLLLATAEGLEAGSTPIKVNSVQVGHVQSVRLTDDYSGAIAEIQMNPGTADLLAADSRFWVVKPRIGRQGISGLNTILSGAYIQLLPGKKAGTVLQFTALQHPPITSTGVPGVSLVLTGSSASSLNAGDPVVYQGQTVGKVETVKFSVEQRRMRYRIFIRAPYSQIISATTQFWMRSGFDLHIGADGVNLRTGSLQTIVAGGITFGQPEGVAQGAPIDDDARFKLYATRAAARQDRFDWQIQYVLLLPDSVRGLTDGAPVLYRGIRIGTVKQVPYFTSDLDYSSLDGFRVPVLIAIEPQRIANWLDWSEDEWRTNMQKLFEHGLRASIESANFLTGAMLISLHFKEGKDDYTARSIGGYPVFPAAAGTISNIQQQITALLKKFNDLQLGGIVSSMQGTLATISSTTQSLNTLLKADDTKKLAAKLADTLGALQQTLAAYQQGAPVYQQLGESLQHLNRILRDLEPLIDTLNKNPNALIFGAPPNHDPVPQAAP